MPAPEADQKILDEAKKRFELCQDAERDLRAEAKDDLLFRAGGKEQWPEEIRAMRKGKPCLTINVLPARERQILNDQRQNRQSIKVSPVDDKGDKDTAKVIEGIVRHIEYDSNADVAYDTAFAAAVRAGFGGFVQVATEYEDEDSFNQVVKIKRVLNGFQIYSDPNSKEVDYSDMDYLFQMEDYEKDEYQDEFPKSEMATIQDWSSVGDQHPDWMGVDWIRVSNYWYRDYENDTLYLMPDGSSKLKSELGEEPAKYQKKRDIERCTVKYCKHNAREILERKEWPGKWIPFVPILGDELYIDGKRILEGMVRHTKDPVRMQNYMKSALVEAIALAKRGSWVVAEGQLQGHEKEWQTPDPKILQYRPVDVAGRPAERPQMVVAEPAVQAINEASAMFVDDLKAVTGIYDAQLGARSNENSGKAISARKVQGEVSNFHYVDNLSRAIRQIGRIVLDLIPKIYDTQRVMRIIGEDGSHDTVTVNGPDPKRQAVAKIYDLTVGRYDVVVSTGPSYQTLRQEAAEQIAQFLSSNPELIQVFGDLLFKNMDWPGAQELSDRAKKLLPPQLQDDDGSDPETKVAQLTAQVQQKDQEAQAMHAYAQQVEQQAQQLQMEKQAKVVEQQGRMAIEQLHSETQIAVAEITSKAQNLRERMKLEFDLNSKLRVQASDQAHQVGMSVMDKQFDHNITDQQHAQALEQSQVGHEQTLEQSQQGHEQTLEQQDQAGQQAMAQQEAQTTQDQ